MVSTIVLMGHAAAASSSSSSSSAKRGRDGFERTILPHPTRQRTVDNDSASSLNSLALVAIQERELEEQSTTPAMRKIYQLYERKDFPTTRRESISIIHNAIASPKEKASAFFMIALMNYHGQGKPADYPGARAGFQSTLDNLNASLKEKSTAKFLLSLMDIKGQDVLVPVNYTKVREVCIATLDDTTHIDPEYKACARYIIAFMDYFEFGCQKDYVAARAGFLEVVGNDYAYPKNKATSRFILAFMDYYGQGGPIDYPTARAGFIETFESAHALPAEKETARIMLEDMGCSVTRTL